MDADPNLFWTIFGAVLAAIIMGGTFFWGAITYTRMEREGTQHTKKGNAVFFAFMLPLGFLGLAFYIAMGGQ